MAKVTQAFLQLYMQALWDNFMDMLQSTTEPIQNSVALSTDAQLTASMHQGEGSPEVQVTTYKD